MISESKRVVLLSGTSRGLGKAIAEQFLANDWQVYGCSRSASSINDSLYVHLNADVSDEKSVKKMFFQIRKEAGKLDLLINNAGIISKNYAMLTSVSEVNNVVSTNFTGTFLLCREACKIMKKNQFGRIVNISSIAVPLAEAGSSIYSASKAAVEQLTKVLGREVADDGITVNSLELSFVKGTGMFDSFTEKQISSTLEYTATGRAISAEEVFDVINFLASSKAGSITMQTIRLGGF